MAFNLENPARGYGLDGVRRDLLYGRSWPVGKVVLSGEVECGLACCPPYPASYESRRNSADQMSERRPVLGGNFKFSDRSHDVRKNKETSKTNFDRSHDLYENK